MRLCGKGEQAGTSDQGLGTSDAKGFNFLPAIEVINPLSIRPTSSVLAMTLCSRS
jgi:hypothetical protein